MGTKSSKHARKVKLDSSINNAIAHAVDARKVASFTASAAGVIAGAALALGTTPAVAVSSNAMQSGNDQNIQSNLNNDQSDSGADANGVDSDSTDNSADANGSDSTSTYSDRSATPDPTPKVNSEITISKETKDKLPNLYAWGSSDNTYILKGQNQEVTFNFAKPTDGSTITKVAIFPSDGNTVDNTKSRKFLEYYSDSTEHQQYSGTYDFKVNADGTATLKMTKLYRDGNLKSGESYSANRCIYVYGTDKDGKAAVLYKTNIVRAATLIPPKTAGSIVLEYNQELTAKQIQDKLKAALDAPTEATGKQSIRDQITAASTSKGVGVRDVDAKTFTNTPDDPENKVIINDQRAYNQDDVTKFNSPTSKQGATETTYTPMVRTLKTHLITDTGYTSDDLPLTVARYDTRIDKPTVEDLSNVSEEVKTEIKRKLAHLNHVSEDSVVINDDNTVTINFNGVDEKDAPKIKLSDLVLKKLKDGEYKVPTGSEAVFVANPLGYSKAEIERIKQAIFDANKDNTELGLTSKDQITLEYVTGDTTVGHENIGISNGQAENTITVKIKTNKAVAEFTSDIKANKLTKLPNIRTDYDVTWTKTKIDGRDTDEGISWSNDQKNTIIYRYDPTKAQEFDTTKILGLLTATPKDNKSGLRTLNGGELLSYEGTGNNARKSHMHYALQGSEPTGELTLGNMGGAYWSGNQKVSNSDVDLGDNLSIAGPYSWDPEAGPVTVAGKKDKIFKARLFVEPYAMTYYKDVYLEKNRHPGNTAKAINVIFVPQTNHKTSDLKTAVEEHKTVAVEGKDVPTQPKYYNASADKKDAYDKALETAKTLLDTVKDKQEKDLTEEQKAQIDNATINLNKARAELDGANTNKDGLNQSIEADGTPTQGQQATTGTKASDKYKNVTDPDFKDADGNSDTAKNAKAAAAKKAYDEALEKAKTVTADNNATQKAVDEAKAELDKARQALNEFSTNKDKLNAAIAEHGKVKTGDADKTGNEKLKTADPAYQNATDDERKAYDDAVKKANDLLADPNASQKEVNEAIAALEKAKKALDAKATDKSQLITAEKLTFDNPDPKDASKQSTFYKNAKTKSESTDASVTAEQKDAAKKAYEAYDTALDNARKVLKNDKATQAEVDDAKKKLEAAEKVLHEKYASNADELTKVLADNFSGYLMPAYFNAFDKAQAGDADAKKAFKDYNDAYQKAKELKQKLEEAKNGGTAPDQRLINEAKTALEKARTVIDKYATNTSRLSAAAFNDLAIQNSPAYKNASADDASAEAKAAKKKYDDAVTKLHQALNKKMPKDQANGKDIPDTNTPEKDGNLDDKDYLKNIQAHAQGEPLDRDIDAILKEMNEAAAELNKFATKTDDLLKSINEHDNTKQTPAYKNASQPDFKNDDGTTADDAKNAAAKRAVDEYGDALNAAKDLLKKPDATQKEVNDALNTLNEKRSALDAYNTDTAKLKESVKKHGSTDGAAPTEGTQTSDAYRNASDPHFMKEEGGKLVPDKEKNEKAAAAKKAYDDALTKAQELLKKHDDNATPQDAKPIQKEIDAALKALDDARTEIEKYKTVTTDLEKEINKSTAEHAPAVTENDFENTPEFKNAKAKTSNGVENTDVTAYKEALKKARDLAKASADQDTKNSKRPTQQQINDALDALKAAKKQITDNYKTNLEPLTSAKDFAGGGFKKTPEYQNAVAKKAAGDQGATQALGEDGKDTGFDNILKKVTEKLNDKDWKQKATQKEVNALLKQLKDAQDNIAKNYKTDAIKLEREVGDKDQDGKPVVPPFEASVTYKNALEKANAGDNNATAKLKEYTEKLKTAQELVNKVNNPDPNAKPEDRPTQAQVDKALTELKAAKDAITNGFKTNVDALQKEADDKDDKGNTKDPSFENTTEFANLKAKQDGDKKPDDLVAYEKALAKAKELIDKNDGEVADPTDPTKKVAVPKDQLPTQQEVDAAQKALKEIKDKILANYKTKVNDLKTEAAKSKDENSTPGSSTTPSTDTKFEDSTEFKNADAKKGEGGKENADVTAYKEALKKARTLLNKFDENGKPKQGETSIPTQKEVDAALDALKAAKKKITESYKTDKSALKSETGKDSDFKKTVAFMIGRKDDIDAYKKALANAQRVLADPNATQAQVDAALKALQDAKNRIISYYGVGGIYDSSAVDKSELRKEVNNSGDASAKANAHADSAAAKAYKKALANAQRVLADPNATQAQVDAALKALRDAKAALQDYANSSSQNNANGKLPNTGLNATFFASFSALFAAMGIGIVSTRRKHSKR